MPKLNKDAAFELRMAAIQYKVDQGGLTCAELSRRAGLGGVQQALPRFLHGESDSFDDHEKLARFLKGTGQFPLKPQIAGLMAYAPVSGFFQNHSNDIVFEKLSSVEGCYECYQWSSTRPGSVLISKFDINYQKDDLFARVTEHQSVGSKVEYFDGCCFYSHKSLVFVMREKNEKRPKFIICDVMPIEDKLIYIAGITLKSSTRKSLHISSMYFEKSDNNVVPRIELFENIAQKAKDHLNEPLTPFNLTIDEKKYQDTRDELMIAMQRIYKSS